MVTISNMASLSHRTQKIKRRPRQRWPFVKKRIYPSGAVGWMADARTKTGGERKSFPTEHEAMTYAQQCRTQRANEGLSAFRSDGLARYGKTVQDAITFYMAVLQRQEKSIPFSDAVAELVALKRGAGKTAQYCRGLETRLDRFAKDHGSQAVALFDSKTLDAWLARLPAAPATRNTFRRDLRTLFSFCEKRGYSTSNPAHGTEAAKMVDAPPGILTTTEAAYLLAASDREIRAWNAISLFAGLRTAELEKLDWQQVHLDSGLIEVLAKNTKTARRRLVRIEPNLMAWLATCAQPAGPVTPMNTIKRLNAARRRAGFGHLGSETKDEHKSGLILKPWPKNAGRHSFGSYWLAKHQDAAALALQMGNSPQIVFAHYRELVKPRDAERYWTIMPDAADEKVGAFGSS